MTITAIQLPISRLRRRWRIFLAIIAVLAVLCVVADAIMGSMFRSRLAANFRENYGMDLQAGSAWYLPPRGVFLHNARFIKTNGDAKGVEVFSARRMVLKLESASIEDQQKLGDAEYKVNYAKVTGGQIRYAPAGQEPVILDGIDFEISPTGGATRLYRYFADANAKDAKPIRSAGAINVNQNVIAIADLALRVKIDAAISRCPMSDSTRRKLDDCKIGGILDIRGSASVPMTDWSAARYKAIIQLSSANFVSQNGGLRADRIDGEFALEGERDKGLSIEVHQLKATTGATMLVVDGGKFATDDDGANWKLAEVLGRIDIGGGVAALDRVKLLGRFNFTGGASGPLQWPKDATLFSAVKHELVAYPVDVSIQPAIYPLPVDHINGGPIRCQGGAIRFENLNGNYGGDKVVLGEAHITLEDPREKLAPSDLRSQVRVDGIIGSLICKQPGPVYPSGLGTVVAQLRPSGPFAISGWYGINRKLPDEATRPKADYFFHVSTAGGAFALTASKAPLTNIRADATVSPMLVDITRLHANMFGGEVIASTKIMPVHPVRYDGTATFYNANLAQAWRELNGSQPSPVVGVAYLKARVSGMGPGGIVSPRKSIAGKGEFEIVDGNFGDLATIRAAAKSISKPDQSLDGRAAGVFSLRDEKIKLANCAVGNSLYGLQGSGTIGLDRNVDLHVVAAPLGDWQIALKQANIPVLANLAAPIENLFNGAQHALLYDVHITGPATNPIVATPTPVPVITRPIAAIFGQLIGAQKDAKLIDQLRTKDDTADQGDKAPSK